jgi:hypothetical protein
MQQTAVVGNENLLVKSSDQPQVPAADRQKETDTVERTQMRYTGGGLKALSTGGVVLPL